MSCDHTEEHRMYVAQEEDCPICLKEKLRKARVKIKKLQEEVASLRGRWLNHEWESETGRR